MSLISPASKALAVGLLLIVVVGMVGVGLAYEEVPEGHQGVSLEWGAVSGETAEPGVYWKTPIQENLQFVEVRPRTYTMSKTIGEGEKTEADAIRVKTVNGSSVDVDITIRYRIDENRSDEFVKEWNNEEQMEKRLIRPTIRSQLRDEASDLQTTGQGAIYTREGREALASTAREALHQEFEGQPVVLEAVQIRNIDLPDDIDRTLDEKEQAKQQIEVERERVRQEEQRKRQEIIQAEAEAESIAIEAEAYEKHPVMLEAEYIKAIDGGSVFVVPEGQEQSFILDASNATASTGNATMSEMPTASGDN